MACGAILLEPYLPDIHTTQIWDQEVLYHGSVTVTIDGYSGAFCISEEERANDATSVQPTPNSAFLRM